MSDDLNDYLFDAIGSRPESIDVEEMAPPIQAECWNAWLDTGSNPRLVDEDNPNGVPCRPYYEAFAEGYMSAGTYYGDIPYGSTEHPCDQALVQVAMRQCYDRSRRVSEEAAAARLVEQSNWDASNAAIASFQDDVNALNPEQQLSDLLSAIAPQINVCAGEFVSLQQDLQNSFEAFQALSSFGENLVSSGATRGGIAASAAKNAIAIAKQQATSYSVSSTYQAVGLAREEEQIIGWTLQNSIAAVAQWWWGGCTDDGEGDESWASKNVLIRGPTPMKPLRDSPNNPNNIFGPEAYAQNGIFFYPIDSESLDGSVTYSRGHATKVTLSYYLVLIAIQLYFCGILKRFVGGQSSAGDFTNGNMKAILHLCSNYGHPGRIEDHMRWWSHRSKLGSIITLHAYEPAREHINPHAATVWRSYVRTNGLRNEDATVRRSSDGTTSAGGGGMMSWPTTDSSGGPYNDDGSFALGGSIMPSTNVEGNNIWQHALDAVDYLITNGPTEEIITADELTALVSCRQFLEMGRTKGPAMKRAWQCIYDEWQKMEDLQEELAAEIDELGDEAANAAAETAFDPDGLNRYVQSIVDDVVDTISDFDALSSIYYARNPERQFFKEQCYLLTHVHSISKHKKDAIDVYERAMSAIHEEGGDIDEGLPLAVLRESTSSAELTRQAQELEENGYETTISRGYSKKTLPYIGYNNQGPDYQEKYGAMQFNSSLMVDGDPYAFINKLVVSNNQGPLINIENHVLHFLQPHIRLFKVEYDDNNNETDVEIKFDAYRTELESMLYSTVGLRNSGVGLKSFEFTYDGDNPFGAKKSIKANLKIFSNSFDELFVVRRDSNAPYRYIDLALKTLNTGAGNYGDIVRENTELQKLNFRLKAQVGWSVPRDESLSELLMTETELEEFKLALRGSIQTLNLIPTIHEFKVDDLGRVDLDIKYLAYIDELFDQSRFNVFSEAQYAANRILRNLKMRYYQGAGRCSRASLRTIREQFVSEVDDEVANSIANLIDRMIRLDRIYYIKMDVEQIREFVSQGPFAPGSAPVVHDDDSWSSALQGEIASALDIYRRRNAESSREFRQQRTRISTSLAAINPEYQVLSFFYLSDLIDTILANIEHEIQMVPNFLVEQNQSGAGIRGVTRADIDSKISEYRKYRKAFRKLRFLLGPMELVKPDGNSTFVNLGDLPISVKYFFEWLTSTMLDKEESYYSLTNFLNDFMNKLVRQFLNSDRCFGYQIRQNLRMNQVSITGPQHVQYRNNETRNTVAGAVKDPITVAYLRMGKIRANIDNGSVFTQPILLDDGTSDYTKINAYDEVNYMIYFVGQTIPVNAMCGNKQEDEEKGIYHYKIGRDKGLVKTIDLKKTTTPGLQEVRFEQQGYDGLEQLRVIYDAQIQSYANTNTYPGTYIFIDPAGFSPNNLQGLSDEDGQLGDLTKYGIGGYYMIIRSTHKYGPGEANSIIEAKWVNHIYCDESSDSADPIPRQFIQRNTGAEDDHSTDCSSYETRASSAEDA